MIKRKVGTLLESERDIMRAVGVKPRHVYALAQSLDRPQSTLSEAVRRLAAMGYLTARAQPEAMSGSRYRPARRVYRLTPKGRRAIRDADRT